MSQRKRGRFPWLFLLAVVVPTVLAGVYYYKYASDQYVSEAHFIIQGNAAPKLDFLGALTGIPGAGGGTSDAMVIRDYLRSMDFLKDIQDVVDIRKHFSAPTIDEYARLPADASAEDLLEYWQQMAEVDHDLTSGISTIRITGFDPKTSQLLVATALKQSERLVNKLSDSLRTDALIMAEKEAAQAEKEVAAIRAETTRFREKQDVLDPAAQAGARIERAESARSGMVAQLQADLARAEAELAQLSTFLQPEALKVKNLQSKVNALRQQVAKEQATSSRQSQGQSRQVAVQLSKYTELQSRQAFAEQLYQAKLGSLEQARLESARKQRYLTVTVQPNLPDEALKPERISGVLTVLLLSFLCWGIGSLSIAAIRDHVGWV